MKFKVGDYFKLTWVANSRIFMVTGFNGEKTNFIEVEGPHAGKSHSFRFSKGRVDAIILNGYNTKLYKALL